ncbi:MAG: hypothetical protein WDW38_005169 [Sanguina aurantia]
MGAGSTKNGRNSNAQRRGIKVFGGQEVKAGGIIVRQLGSKWYAGDNADMGKDFTVFSKVEGIVIFDKKKEKAAIHVYPLDHAKAIACVKKTHTTAAAEGTVSRAERRKTQYTTRRKLRAVSVATVAVPVTAMP